ncbi:hypothetical protein M5689_015354 [Euphorbia peplus]|nr:hypothetical protein M5689_015354 [Euphorbia peplus]
MEADRMIGYGIQSNKIVQEVSREAAHSNGNFGDSKLSQSAANKDEDMLNISSYQCSSCFSIDLELLKPYECEYRVSSPTSNQGRNKDVIEVDQTINNKEMIMKQQVDYPKNAVHPNQTSAKFNKTTSKDWLSGCNLLGCFHPTTYEKCSKSFNNH